MVAKIFVNILSCEFIEIEGGNEWIRDSIRAKSN